MNLHLTVLAFYSLALMALGLWIGRRSGAADFFVASRRLGPGLIFSTMLAANIGAGSTVGATATAYRIGAAAWWWVGSAGVGCAILAFWVGPRMRQVAAEHGLRTVGDYLEFRYSRHVRGIIGALLWVGGLFILATQLIALGWILNVVVGLPKAIGCGIGGLVVVVYFAAGGLLTSAWVNVVQLTVKMVGFAIALPLAVSWLGGWGAVRQVNAADEAYWAFWSADTVKYLALFVPPFIVSPGLLQKIFGARDDRAVRLGVGLNALALLAFAGVPVLLGIVAQGKLPGLVPADLALPTIFMQGLPAVAGALALAAVFSAEVSAADAVLLMLTTSLSQDLYKRFVNPSASDPQVLAVARWATILTGVSGVALAVVSEDLVRTLTVFYALLGVSLFVPIVAGLYVPRTSNAAALASIAAGVTGMTIVHLASGGEGWGVLTPAPAGLVAATVAWAVVLVREAGPVAARLKPY
ncbi:MAG: sodium:solute symporter family protein [Luteitalea sp.]|nr:sodium:solute symporter family protein [Luteitalea sp.]